MNQPLLVTLVKVPDITSGGQTGYVGLVRSPQGLKQVSHLHPSPEAAANELRTRFLQLKRDDEAFGDLPQRLERYFHGEPASFADASLDWEGIAPFHRQVYQAALGVPWGQVLSYGELATRAGRPGAARAVGQAMARNPWPFVVP